MKTLKKLAIIAIMLCTGCGSDADNCDDNKAIFPNPAYKVYYTVRNTYNYLMNDSALNPIEDSAFIDDYSKMNTYGLSHNYKSKEEYAVKTCLKNCKGFNINNVRYNKLFDGQTNCQGALSNSRLNIYSDGIVMDLKANLKSAEAIALYMTHNYKVLKAKVTISLFKNTSDYHNATEFDEYSFSFYTNLGEGLAGARFFYINLNKLEQIASNFKVGDILGSSMVGFKYERLPLDENNDPKFYASYIDSLEVEKDTTRSEQSFIKLYDIGLPFSTWR